MTNASLSQPIELPTYTGVELDSWVVANEPIEAGLHVDAAEFQAVMFGELGEDEYLMQTAFAMDPLQAGRREWVGWAVTTLQDYPDRNTFVAPAVFKGLVEVDEWEDGAKTGRRVLKKRRRYELMQRMTCVPLDDTRLEDATYVVQTSPSSHQSWFKLVEPITDADTARRLAHALQQRGMQAIDPNDPNGNNGVRWARMPLGVNTKAKYGQPFRHVVEVWNPDRVITLDALIERLELDLWPLSAGAGPNSLRVSGRPKNADLSERPASPCMALVFTPENQARVEEALAAAGFSPDDDRDLWRDSVWSILSLGEGWEAFARDWSARSERFTEEGFENVVASYEPGKTGFERILRRAIDNGWSNPFESAASDELQGEAKGDILNGRIFARLHRGALLWVHELKVWLAFDDDSGWTLASPEADLVAFKDVIAYQQQYIAQELAKLKGGEVSMRLKRLMVHIDKSCTLPKARAGIEFAKSEGLTVRASELDADPMQLGLLNGVLDLKVFQLQPYRPDTLVTKRARANFDLQAQAPHWHAFLKEILPDPEVRRFLRVFFGYVLTGRVDLQVFLFLYGTGANGKSVFIAVLAQVLGEYARRIPTEMLMAQPRSSQGPSPDIMLLKGLRLAFANETEEGSRLAEARIKDMTSLEPLTGREPYGSFVTFNPSHSLVIVGNHRPIVHDDSWGMWRRMCQVPFEVTIPPERQDPKLFDRLIAEADGILLWILCGLREYQRDGLKIPTSVQAATQAYREDMDIIGDWLADRCLLRAEESESRTSVFNSYQDWAQKNGYRPMSSNSLTRRLKSRGIQLDTGRRNYLGVAVKTCRPAGSLDA